MISRSQKFRLGVFVLVSFGLTLGMLVAVMGTKLTERRDIYFARFTEAVSGLDVGAQVKYHGVKIGMVQAIEINRENISEVIVRLSLKRGTPIKKDTTVTLAILGVTGLKSLELVGGTNEAEFLPPGSEIKTAESFVSKITGKADVIAEKVELIVNRFVDLTEDKQRGDIKDIIANVARITGEAATFMENSRPDLEATVQHIENITYDGEKIASEMAEFSSELNVTIVDLRTMTYDMNDLLQESIRRADTNLDSVLKNTDVAVASLAEILSSPETRSVPNKVVQLLVGTQELIKGTQEDLSRISFHLEGAAAGVESRIGDQRVDEVLDNAAIVSQNLDGLVQGLDLTVRQSREDIFKTLSNLKDVVSNLNDFTQMLLENPSILLRGSQLKEREQ